MAGGTGQIGTLADSVPRSLIICSLGQLQAKLGVARASKNVASTPRNRPFVITLTPSLAPAVYHAPQGVGVAKSWPGMFSENCGNSATIRGIVTQGPRRMGWAYARLTRAV